MINLYWQLETCTCVLLNESIFFPTLIPIIYLQHQRDLLTERRAFRSLKTYRRHWKLREISMSLHKIFNMTWCLSSEIDINPSGGLDSSLNTELSSIWTVFQIKSKGTSKAISRLYMLRIAKIKWESMLLSS